MNGDPTNTVVDLIGQLAARVYRSRKLVRGITKPCETSTKAYK